MATTATLRALNDPTIGHALFIHGIQQVFVDNAELVYPAYNFGGSVRGTLGLKREGMQFGHAIDMRRSRLLDNPHSFSIHDYDGTLARLFAAVDSTERELGNVPIGAGLPIHPNDSLAARSALWNKNVGTERIGPAGERAIYNVPPTFTVAGEHSITVPGIDLQGAPVSDNPIVWNGRRFVLYRIYKDATQGGSGWRPFSEAVRLTWGTLRDAGKVSSHDWQLEGDGPESWLRKPLGIGFSDKPVRAIGEITLVTTGEEREDFIGVQLRTSDPDNDTVQYGGVQSAITATTADEIRDDVISAIDAAAVAATTYLGAGSSVWNNTAGYSVQMAADGAVTIAVASAVGDAGGILQVCLHRKAWSALGYDIELQNSLEMTAEEPRAVHFSQVGESGSFASVVPGPDYWTGIFQTGHADWNDTGGMDNDGHSRTYRPQYVGGTNVLRWQPGTTGQVVHLADSGLGGGVASTSVAHPGQNDRPIASDPSSPSSPITINGAACDRQGWFLFFGKRRMAGSDEIFDEWWPGRCCWKNGGAQQDGLISGDTVVVVEWGKPRRFGFDRPQPASDWIGLASNADPDDGMIQAIPLCVLGYSESSSYDVAHVVAQRLLLSTGTSNGWNSYAADPDAVLDAGDNEPAGWGDTHQITRDAERASLGLGVPQDFVASPSAWAAQAAKLEDDAILLTKTVFTAGYQSEDALVALMQPLGWCWHLRGGKYGPWCPADVVTLANADVVLDRSKKSKQYNASFHPTSQELRKWQPVDKWTISYQYNPKDRSTWGKLELLSPDPHLRYRPGEVDERIIAHAHRRQAFAGRCAELARFWARRHFEVKGWQVHAIDPGEDLWPGTIVRITDDTLVDVLGSYGVTSRMAVVTATRTTGGKESLTKTVDLMIFADRASQLRYHAPVAQATAYDTATRTLTCVNNWARLEGDGTWRDAPCFSEPLYTGVAQFGGAARIEVWQWDGDGWVQTLTGRVQSTTSTTIVLESGTTSGTYMRDQDALVVLRTPQNQDSASVWPAQIYSPICDAAGNFTAFGGGSQAGYPWEA